MKSLLTLLPSFFSAATNEMVNFGVIMKNIGSIKYDVNCMDMNSYYTLNFPINANVEWDIVPPRLVPSREHKMDCKIEMFGGSAFDGRNGNDYGCLGRCGPGCSGLPPWRDTSTWSIDCLKHDVCSYYFSDTSGSSVAMCKDALLSAADDFMFPVCMKTADETVWSKSQGTQGSPHDIFCDGFKVQPGGALLLEE